MKTSAEICFVCGSKGASNIIYVRPHEDGQPYFSFLESHMPPRGARRPNGSGVVNSCTVCFAFLIQQWNAFERSRTPLVKRLYWLKRVDNGTFTGAEMSVQGEYMAQLMGLHGIGASPCGASLFGAGNQSGIPCGEIPSPASPDYCESVASDYANGALDLSVSPRKPEAKARKRNPDAQISRAANSTRKKALSAPPGAMPVTKNGVTRVCADCRKSLTRQWRVFDSRGTAEHDRSYRVGNCAMTNGLLKVATDGSNGQYSDSCQDGTVCYICAEPNSFSRMKWIATHSSLKSEMNFPFLARLECPPQACTISSNGLARICHICYRHLEKQWKQFEAQGVPVASRNYVLHHFTKNAEEFSKLKLMNSFDVKSDCTSDELPMLPSERSKCENSATKFKEAVRHINTSGILMDYVMNSKIEVFSQKTQQRLGDMSESTSCFVCGVLCDGSLLDANGDCHTLYSKPIDNAGSDSCEDSKGELSTPFFPFLEQLDSVSAKVHASKKPQAFDVCSVCYCYLIQQWKYHEQSGSVSDLDRWERSYHYKTILCDLCRTQVERTDIAPVSCIKSVEYSSKNSDRIALVCSSCRQRSLSRQYGVDENGVACETRTRATTYRVTSQQVLAGARESSAQLTELQAAEAKDARPTSNCSSESSRIIDSVDQKGECVNGGRWKPSTELQFECHRAWKNHDETRNAVSSSSLDLRTVSTASSDLQSIKERPASSDDLPCSDRHTNGGASRLTPRDGRSALVSGCVPHFDHSGAVPSCVSPVQARAANELELTCNYGVQSFSADPVTSSALLMMHSYLMQQSPHLAAFNPLMSLHYPGLPSLLPSAGPLMRPPPSLELFLSRPLSDTSSVRPSSRPSSVDKKRMTKQEDDSGRHPDVGVEISSRPGANVSDAPPVGGTGVALRDSDSGSTFKSAVSVARQRPIFHRPFLDDDAVTSSTTCIDEELKATSRPREALAPVHGVQVWDQLHETVKVELESPARENSDVLNLEAEASSNDGRLSAALGLISLAARTKITCSETESSVGCQLHSPSAAKRPRFESSPRAGRDVAPESVGVESSEADPMLDSGERNGCAWERRCVGGKKLNTEGCGVSDASFSWPGIDIVIEAYIRHLQEERVERLVLAERQVLLKSVNQQLTESASQLEVKLEEAKSVHLELASQGDQLKAAITSLNNCLNFSM